MDQHAINQTRFGLPSRVTAKIFVFRLIYGGTSWSYCNDPDFNWISSSPKYWQGVIDSFYDKYRGIRDQHQRWMNEAVSTGKLTLATGRTYRFTPFRRPDGSLKWPRTKILNYPVQGLGHDLTTIARVSLFKRITTINVGSRIDFISTVHDSIVLDLQSRDLQLVRPIISSVFDDLPDNFRRLFNVEFNLPVKYELSVGKNLLDMEAIL